MSAYAPIPDAVATTIETFERLIQDDSHRLHMLEAELAALAAADWRIAGPGGAAELLGVRPSTLADRVKTLGIRRPVPARRGRRPT